jgi:hypothetical protein
MKLAIEAAGLRKEEDLKGRGQHTEELESRAISPSVPPLSHMPSAVSWL